MTEEERTALLAQLPAEIRAGIGTGPIWTTQTLQEDFKVQHFLAPYVFVIKRETGEHGMLRFTHQPRIYFGWTVD